MVSGLLGPSLEDLFNFCGRKSSPKTVLMLVHQLIGHLEYIHSKNVIHRDIRSENFLMGLGKHGNQVYVTDLGEISAINKTQNFALLNDIACEDDWMLVAEVKKEMDSRAYNADDWKAGGDSKIWLGNDNAFGVNSKGHNFARFTVSDHTDVHLGI